MNIEEMKRKKKELGYTYEQIADASGVPLGTVQKIFGGVTASPRYDTLRALEKVFVMSENTYVREPIAAYDLGGQGGRTLKDYLELPEDKRAELIDGVIYDMASPTAEHQLLVGQVYSQLNDYIRREKGTCMPFSPPIDVQLDCDERTIVQPDLLVVCDREKIWRQCIYGAPDFIIEVLSQSTKKKDMFIKLQKYMEAGVREYWMVDPDKRKVIVYDFEHDDYPVLYGVDVKVPVRIFDGECVIDFKEIYEYISFLYERS